nr:hypothetical protein [Tanacetum cinerariifolium]
MLLVMTSHIPLPQAPIAPPTVLSPSLVLPPSPMFDSQDFFLPEEILPPQKRARFLSSSSTDSSAPPQREQMRHDEEIVLAGVRISTLEMIIKDIQISYLSGRGMKPLGSEPVPEKLDKMAPKRTSTSAAPAMTHAAIKKLVADSVAAALEVQDANMANTDNTNKNTREREAPIARKCSYKKFM